MAHTDKQTQKLRSGATVGGAGVPVVIEENSINSKKNDNIIIVMNADVIGPTNLFGLSCQNTLSARPAIN